MNPAAFIRSNPRANALLAILWMAVIFAASSLPSESIPASAPPYASIFHLMEYFILGFLVLPLAVRRHQTILSAVILCALYAASDEFHQIFVAGRTASLSDWAVDVLGALLGAHASRRWNLP